MVCVFLPRFNSFFFFVTLQLVDDGDIAKKSRELNAKVARLQSNLQRINAPNMRADEKCVCSVSNTTVVATGLFPTNYPEGLPIVIMA
jgi:hypothetical protein